MSELYYRIKRRNSEDIISEYAMSDPSDLNVTTRGDTSRILFHFNGDEDKTFTSDTTIASGELAQFGDITINNGVTVTVNGILTATSITVNGTLTVNGEVFVYTDVFGELLTYDEWAGNFATIQLLNGETKYREQVTTSEIDSLLVGIEPSDTLENKNISGFWALLSQVTDERDRALADNRIELELTVLSELSDYADHAAVENDLLV